MKTDAIIRERAALIDQIQPVRWDADEPSGPVPEQACVMQMAAWLAGEQWTDRPACVDPQLAELMRTVNDNLPEDVLSTWAPQVAPLTVGVTDASALLDRLSVRRLRESVLPLAPSWPDEVRDQVVGAVEQVITAIESGDRTAARSAAKSARSAAQSAAAASAGAAAKSAAESAERSATLTVQWAASVAAELAASATASAESTREAWSAEADRILDELRREHNGDN